MTLPRPFDYRYLRPPDRVDVYHAVLLHESADYLVLTHVVHPAEPAVHLGKEVLVDGSRIVWFLFKGKPYDVGRFYRPDGAWTGYYVDITEPVQWTDSDADTLESVVDLFLDVWIAPDGNHEVLDEDEFEEAIHSGHLTDEQVAGARAALVEVLSSVAAAQFPPPQVSAWESRHYDFSGVTWS
jgi:predicted RNA-binding protein associated with RNAse of E/G family